MSRPTVLCKCKCGKEYNAPANMLGRMVRCPECQRAHRNERARERRRTRPIKTGKQRGSGVLFRLVSDPCDSWGTGCFITLVEIRELTRLGYLDPGMVWESINHDKQIEITGEGYRLHAV